MHKISEEVIKSIEITIENWRVELTAGGKMVSKCTNPERYIPERFAITLTICYRDDALQLQTQVDISFINCKKKNQSSNVHRRQETVCQKLKGDGIYHRKLRNAEKEKETLHAGKNRTTKSRKKSEPRGKGNLQTLGNTRSEHHQTRIDERKFFLEKNEKTKIFFF